MKSFFLAFAVVASLLISGCDELENLENLNPLKEEGATDSLTTFVIAAGSHYADQSEYKALTVDKLKFRVRFDSSAIYATTEKNNQEDINKLYGVSDCGSTHQVNSARFGWRWFQNRLEIWAYTYVKSERKYTFVDTVSLNASSTCEIRFGKNEYVFSVNNTTVTMPRACQDKANGYKLYPYFGGDETAPHKITIEIEDMP